MKDGFWKKERIFSGECCNESIDDFTFFLKSAKLVMDAHPERIGFEMLPDQFVRISGWRLRRKIEKLQGTAKASHNNRRNNYARRRNPPSISKNGREVKATNTFSSVSFCTESEAEKKQSERMNVNQQSKKRNPSRVPSSPPSNGGARR